MTDESLPYGSSPVSEDTAALLKGALQDSLDRAEVAFKSGYETQRAVLGEELFQRVQRLARTRHAARGVALTLLAYKVIRPQQDVRKHKADFSGGFSARSIDNKVTVPFLQANSLAYNVETHWLSQTFAFAGEYVREQVLKTTPRHAGELLIEVVNDVQESASSSEFALAALDVLVGELVDERNRGKVLLEKPKDLPIEEVVMLLEQHFDYGYEKNAPRLPQLAMYAIYTVLTASVDRYKNFALQPLERMRAANRKSGSVGDIDVNAGRQPIEAVEVKFKVEIGREHVAEAIQKIRTASVERYFILSTAGVRPGEEGEIYRLQREFKRSNGCEIIVNGVLDSIRYYLRLLRSTSEFLVVYAELVEVDHDLGYEHRVAWNRICAERYGGA